MTGPKHLRGSKPGPARSRQVGARGRVATAAVAVTVVAGGCAALPTSGAVQQLGGAVQAGAGNSGAHSQPIPEPPGPGWSPDQIVEGFLAASASFANHHAVAREYLDPSAQRSWQPGWAVTVVSSNPAVTFHPPRREIVGEPSAIASVVVKGLRVATLTNTGQSTTPTNQTASFRFSLREINGQWRITDPLPPYLLLNRDDFQNVYQPRNIYFLAGPGQRLVPDPVFVPQQDTNADLATGLVDALLQAPTGWLQGAATTGFPRNSGLINLKINGPDAIVDLGGKAATASRSQQNEMAAQLAWTLASGSTAIQSVELEINGRPLQIGGRQVQLLDAYSAWMPTPTPSAGSSLYYIGGGGIVKALSGVGPPGSGDLGTVTPVTGAAGTPSMPPLRSIAVSPDGRWIAGISTTGATVYFWDLTHKAAPVRDWSPSSGHCTSLSWDEQGDLWITAAGNVWLLPHVWRLPPGRDFATQVPALQTATVTSFQVAPDGVRAVMTLSSGAPLQLVAIVRSGGTFLGNPVAIGSGIRDPESLSWYDANDVIVLDGSSQLYEVPLNGGPFTAIPSQPGIESVTATNPSGPTTDIAVGLAKGQIMISSRLGAAFESTHANGQAPVYPG